LTSYKIPYRVIGGTKFFDRLEVKDCISYLRLIENPKDQGFKKNLSFFFFFFKKFHCMFFFLSFLFFFQKSFL